MAAAIFPSPWAVWCVFTPSENGPLCWTSGRSSRSDSAMATALQRDSRSSTTDADELLELGRRDHPKVS